MGLRAERKADPRLWTVAIADSPVVATAIHDGHLVRPGLQKRMVLPDDQRLREEDPFTGDMISGVPGRIVVHRSRFECDLNRAREGCVYATPAEAWGLDIWNGPLPKDEAGFSQAFHDDYYEMLESVLRRIEKRFGRFIVLDIHSYNYRRAGADGPPTPSEKAPDINIGTFSMDRDRWADVIDELISMLSTSPIAGRMPDVRENVAFQGKGEQTRFIHERFPETGCAIAIEFRKFFMDEWTGAPEPAVIRDITSIMRSAALMLEKLVVEKKIGGR